MMPRSDLSRLSPEAKDALILALLDRIAALEAKLKQPPNTPDNSSLPPSCGQKANRPPRPKKPRRKRQGSGVTREIAAEPDQVVDCHAQACAHCGTAVTPEDQAVRHAYDHIDLQPIRPVVTGCVYSVGAVPTAGGGCAACLPTRCRPARPLALRSWPCWPTCTITTPSTMNGSPG